MVNELADILTVNFQCSSIMEITCRDKSIVVTKNERSF